MSPREVSQLEEELRTCIEAAALTNTKLSLRSQVAQPVISNFRTRKRGLTPASVEKIARALGYEVRLVKLRKKRSS